MGVAEIAGSRRYDYEICFCLSQVMVIMAPYDQTDGHYILRPSNMDGVFCTIDVL